jgi:hypothetical protein
MTERHAPQSDYTEKEAARRRDELAKRILKMPPQPRKPHPSKLGTVAANPEKKRRLWRLI